MMPTRTDEVRNLLNEIESLRAEYVSECRSHNKTMRELGERDARINKVRALCIKTPKRFGIKPGLIADIQLALGDE